MATVDTVAETTQSGSKDQDWFGIVHRTYDSISDDRVLAVAAGVTFYALLAIFPAIGAGVSIYGLFADAATIGANLGQLSTLLPGGAIDIIGDQIKRLTEAGSGALSLSFIFGLGISLWGANAGVKAIFDALNVAYGAKEERGFFRLNLVSLGFTIGAIIFALLAVATIVALPIVLNYVGLAAPVEAMLRYGRWPIIWMIVALFLAVLYRFGPTVSVNPKWRWITWGSASASLLWLIASVLFSWYAANFGNYNKTYGSLGAAIGLMTWMWMSATVIIIGAELNSEIEKAAGEPHAQRPKNVDLAARAT